MTPHNFIHSLANMRNMLSTREVLRRILESPRTPGALSHPSAVLGVPALTAWAAKDGARLRVTAHEEASGVALAVAPRGEEGWWAWAAPAEWRRDWRGRELAEEAGATRGAWRCGVEAGELPAVAGKQEAVLRLVGEAEKLRSDKEWLRMFEGEPVEKRYRGAVDAAAELSVEVGDAELAQKADHLLGMFGGMGSLNDYFDVYELRCAADGAFSVGLNGQSKP